MFFFGNSCCNYSCVVVVIIELGIPKTLFKEERKKSNIYKQETKKNVGNGGPRLTRNHLRTPKYIIIDSFSTTYQINKTNFHVASIFAPDIIITCANLKTKELVTWAALIFLSFIPSFWYKISNLLHVWNHHGNNFFFLFSKTAWNSVYCDRQKSHLISLFNIRRKSKSILRFAFPFVVQHHIF